MNIYITKKIIITAIIAIPVIIAGYFLSDYLYDQYIINKTQETFGILQSAYAKTIKTANYQWEDGKINTESFSREFVKNLPVKQDCAFLSKECFPIGIHTTYITQYAPFNGGFSNRYYKVKLKNNTSIAIKIDSPNCDSVSKACGTIVMDVNGKNIGPNLLSRDLFDVGIYKDKIDVFSMEGNMYPNCMYGGGFACTAFVVKYKSRDYKKFPEYEKAYRLMGVNKTVYPHGLTYLRKNVRLNFIEE